MSHVRFIIAVCVSACLAGGVLLAQDHARAKPAQPYVSLEILGTKGGVTSIQTAGGWPLTIRIAANSATGIGVHRYPDVYPAGPQQGFIVFDDPDGCFSLSSIRPIGCASSLPLDETYLEFLAGTNLADLLKAPVDDVPAVRLGAAPQLLGWKEGDGNTNPYDLGPYLGRNLVDAAPCVDADLNGVCDNYGYGASPNLPGLVILSDTGVGLVWGDPDKDSLNLVVPRTARNLAGLTNSVAWTLNDCISPKTLPDGCTYGRTGVTAHMNVPGVVPAAPYQGLFTPVVRVDFNQPVNSQFTDVSYQIDGLPWVFGRTLTDLSSDLNSWVTTLRVFVVSGRGPSQLYDANGDGVVTAKDAVRMGYKLLSSEEVVRFRTYHQEEGYLLGIPFDYNGNGMMFPTAPVGGGGVNPIPR
jgi:hypothetical protein